MDHMDLIERYIEDAEALSEEELLELQQALSGDPTVAEELRRQLEFDNLLSVETSTGRQGFESSVTEVVRQMPRPSPFEQRVLDRIAEEEQNRPRPRRKRRRRRRVAPTTRKPGNPLRWLIPVGLVAAACVVIAVIIGTREDLSPLMPTLTQASGDVSIDGTPVLVGQQLSLGKPLSVTSGTASLTYPDGTRILVADQSMMTLVDTSGHGKNKLLRLAAGNVHFQVNKQPAGTPLTVTTRFGSAMVTGTHFEVDVNNARMRVEVTEGSVRVQRSSDGSTVAVPAGNYVVVSPNHTLARKPIDGPVRARPHLERSAIMALQLLNTNTGKPVPGGKDLQDGYTIPMKLAKEGNWTINAVTMPERVKKVQFQLKLKQGNSYREVHSGIEEGRTSPLYTLFGDRKGVCISPAERKKRFAPGKYFLVVTMTSVQGQSSTRELRFSIPAK